MGRGSSRWRSSSGRAFLRWSIRCSFLGRGQQFGELVRVVYLGKAALELVKRLFGRIELVEQFPGRHVVEVLLQNLVDQARAFPLILFLISLARLSQ